MQTTVVVYLLEMCVRSISKLESLARLPLILGLLLITLQNQRKALLLDISRYLAISAQLSLLEVP
jgi:hypothetical protein